jgi:hypothetical protein
MFQTRQFMPTINPAFTSRMLQLREPVLAKLPLAPANGSPVPELTSLYQNSDAGNYGQRSYPGNCGRQFDSRSAALLPACNCLRSHERQRNVSRCLPGTQRGMLVK